jgi:NAD(P)-dependent dehydrogenase (short-subunit alcohol dehydrogenase family)
MAQLTRQHGELAINAALQATQARHPGCCMSRAERPSDLCLGGYQMMSDQKNHLRLEHKTVVITGAGSGIGRASAIRLSEDGANVVGVDVSEDGLAGTAADVQKAGSDFVSVAGSVADLSVLDAAVAAAIERFGGLDCLVNNAAIPGPRKPFDEALPSEFDEIVAINLKAVWYALKIARGPMKSRGGGAIVNIASAAAKRPDPSLPLYSMTKAGVVALTLQTALTYARDQIRVNCICPGPVDTQMSNQHLAQISRAGPYEVDELRRRVARTTAVNRFGTPAELAAAISFLLSADSSFITGAVVPVDGGMTLK